MFRNAHGYFQADIEDNKAGYTVHIMADERWHLDIDLKCHMPMWRVLIGTVFMKGLFLQSNHSKLNTTESPKVHMEYIPQHSKAHAWVVSVVCKILS